jgi:hypothetical protein
LSPLSSPAVPTQSSATQRLPHRRRRFSGEGMSFSPRLMVVHAHTHAHHTLDTSLVKGQGQSAMSTAHGKTVLVTGQDFLRGLAKCRPHCLSLASSLRSPSEMGTPCLYPKLIRRQSQARTPLPLFGRGSVQTCIGSKLHSSVSSSLVCTTPRARTACPMREPRPQCLPVPQWHLVALVPTSGRAAIIEVIPQVT